MNAYNDRLSRIETQWSMVRAAHASDTAGVERAQRELIERYGGAVRRYALAALRNEEAADDVLQEFALRFVRGDFDRAAPERGRFRSFVKTCVYHLIIDGQRRRKRDARQQQFISATPEPKAPTMEDHAALFDNSWRDELLATVWQRLEAFEQTTSKPYNTALRMRVEHPEARSPELAEKIGEALGKPMKAGAARVLLHRARETFAELLLDEVAHSLPEARADQLEEELIELDLLEYCRPALEKRQEPPAGANP